MKHIIAACAGTLFLSVLKALIGFGWLLEASFARERLFAVLIGCLVLSAILGVVSKIKGWRPETAYLLGAIISLAGFLGNLMLALFVIPFGIAAALKVGNAMKLPQKSLNVLGGLAVAMPFFLLFQDPIMYRQKPLSAGELVVNNDGDVLSNVNILLVVVDTLRASALEDETLNIPNLRKLQANGVTIENMVASANQTVPGHYSLLTGLFPEELGMRCNLSPLPKLEVLKERKDFKPLASRFQEQGWATFAVAANPLLTANSGNEESLGFTQGFQNWNGLKRPDDWNYFNDWVKEHTWIGWLCPEGVAEKSLFQILRRLLYPIEAKLYRYHFGEGRLVSNRLKGNIVALNEVESPWFGFANYMDVHAPYIPSKDSISPFEEFAMREELRGIVKGGGQDVEKAKILESLYLAELEEWDVELGNILESAKQSNFPLLVVVTSDHGEMFGEHGQVEHGGSLFRNELHIPAILAGLGVPKNSIHEPTCTPADLTKTIAELAGLNTSGLSGRSILDQTEDHWALSFMLGGCSLQRGKWKAIYELNDLEVPPRAELVALFDIEQDSDEVKDLSQANQAIVAQFAQELSRRLGNDVAFKMGQRDLSWNERRLLERMGYLHGDEEDE